MSSFNPPPFQGGQPMQPEPPQAPPKRGRKGRGDAEQQVTKKVVDRNRRFAIIFALVLAVVIGLTVYGGSAPGQYVVRASSNLAAGTQIVDVETQFVAEAVPDEYIEDGAIVAKSAEAALELAADQLTGLRVQYPVLTGQQIHTEDFNVEITLSSPLTANERLLSVQASIGNALAGQIKAGDRVDVVATVGDVSGVILNNVEIVSVTVSENQYQSLASQQTGDNKDSRAEELLPGAPIPGTYVLRVGADDAADIATVAAGASLTFLYRGQEAGDLVTEPKTAIDVICGENTDLPACES